MGELAISTAMILTLEGYNRSLKEVVEDSVGPEDTEICMLTHMQCMVVMDMVVTAMEECTQAMDMVVDQLVVKWVVVDNEAVEEGDAADHIRSRIMGKISTGVLLSFVMTFIQLIH